MSARGRGVSLEDQLQLDRILDDAFAPGRARKAPIAAARVRARVVWDRPQPVSAGWRGVAILGRLGESSLALGMSVVIFVGALGGVTGHTETVQPEQGSEYVVRVSVPLDESRFLRLLRIGRAAPVADNVDPATALAAAEADEGESIAALRERQGLLR